MERGILGNAIRNSRMQNGYSQEQLAELVGIAPTHMKHLESEHRKPSIEVLIKLMETLNFSMDALVFPELKDIQNSEWPLLLADCTEQEKAIIKDLMISMKKNRMQLNK